MTLQQKTFLIFDLNPDGHHASYIKYLSQYILLNEPNVALKIVVSPAYQTKHSLIIKETISTNLEWIFVEDEKIEILNAKKNVLQKSFFEWDLFCEYCAKYKAYHAILMYFDLFQFTTIFKQNPVCDFSGILFRTTLVNYEAENWKEKINYFRKELTLKALLKNKKLKNLFCLDSFAADYIQENWRNEKAKHLADPVEVFQKNDFDKETFKAQLGIEENRKVFLVFGHLDSRKSISHILEAIAALEPNEINKICLLLAGSWDKNEREMFNQKVSQIIDIQIINIDYFIDDESIQDYFEVSDIVLALYQKHIGMSGILNRAAVAQKPVFCYDFGLMAKLVKQYELGVLIPNFDKNALKIAFENILNGNEIPINKSKMISFATQNTPISFAKTIVENCL
jgi:glycosyltransferase involved in cell wall biosynthesis